MKQFDSILVANRGEIAARVIRSAKQQGYRTIAVYSEADAEALHVQLADEAVLIGAPPVKESYLDAEKILQAALATGAQAIHPGYGFLSENAAFSQACEDAGIVFIGPDAHAIELMGNKAAAKRRMLAAGVPCIPGYQDDDQSDAALVAAAEDIGAPVMVKAAAGGGGRGMRLVTDLAELIPALHDARSESENAFGSAQLIIEKAVLNPRHVEIQVFGDQHGNTIHFGERDCSVQRRHQKVVEEAPCPVMTPELREAMGAAAVNAARSIGYVGAGTVEFLLDGDNAFYFLEMNTRLQVEHPVTEMITGQDLVSLQFDVAQGYSLPLSQEQVSLSGHAIEVRLYAEDPANDFLPATGTAHVWLPPEGEGIRVDHGLQSGQVISPFYDPMVAKIIAWGEDRHTARRRLLRALENTALLGLPSNREFLVDVLRQPVFAEGAATTAFIGNHYSEHLLQPGSLKKEHMALGACLLYRLSQAASTGTALSVIPDMEGYSGARQVEYQAQFGDPEQPDDVRVEQDGQGQYRVTIAGRTHSLGIIDQQSNRVRFTLDKVQLSASFCFPVPGEVMVQLRGVAVPLRNHLASTRADEAAAGSGLISAPMHGNVVALLVNVGDTVSEGQDVAVVEAMKMEHRLGTTVAGKVTAVHVSKGQQVASGAALIEIEQQ